MPDNDNGPFSDAERQLIDFISSVRPESASLLKLRAAIEKWLWHSKLCAIICAFAVFEAALLSGWYGLPALLAIGGAIVPLVMIDSLERVLGRWKGRLSFKRGRPTYHWHFVRVCA